MKISDHNFVREHRVGRFVIADHLILEEPGVVMKALSTVLVIRAERLWAFDATEYYAYSPHFDAQPQGIGDVEYTGEFVKNYETETLEEVVTFSGWKQVPATR